jgi:hypothetical protein
MILTSDNFKPESVSAKTIKHPEMAELASTKTSIILDYGDMKRAAINTNHGHEFGPDKQESFVKIEVKSNGRSIMLCLIIVTS